MSPPSHYVLHALTTPQVLELKGNIRVLARVRPLVDKERGQGAGSDALPLKALSEEALRVAAVDNKAEREYEFDRVLSPDDGQEKVGVRGGAVNHRAADVRNVCPRCLALAALRYQAFLG